MSDPVSAWIAEGKKLRGDLSTERAEHLARIETIDDLLFRLAVPEQRQEHVAKIRAGIAKVKAAGKHVWRPLAPSRGTLAACAAVNKGMPVREAARKFDVWPSTVRRALRTAAQGTTAAVAASRPPPKPTPEEARDAKKLVEETLKVMGLRPKRKAGCGHEVPVKRGKPPKECPACRAASVPASQPKKRERMDARAQAESVPQGPRVVSTSADRARREAEPGESIHCNGCGVRMRYAGSFDPPRCDSCARRKGLMPPENLRVSKDLATSQPGAE